MSVTAVLLAGVLCLPHAFLHAAPVTLQFEATVGPPRQGFSGSLPPALNDDLVQGDIISGMFTFEPIDAASGTTRTAATQNLPFKLQIDSFGLESTKYDIEVINDSTTDEGPVTEDRIRLVCSTFLAESTCNPAHVPGNPTIDWAFGITLNGGGDVLEGADIPANVAVWNQLSGSMLVTFGDTLTGDAFGFEATIQSFHLVPEPATGNLFLILCSLSASVVLSSRHQCHR